MKFKVLFIVSIIVCSHPLKGADSWKIYIDADRTGAKASGDAIEMGIRTALLTCNNTLGERKVEVIARDHRGNTRRSLAHIKEFLADSNALVMFSGLHSQPLLANKEFINKNGALTLDPWAAAGPITRGVGSDGKNWIFRLSVDDSKAGALMVEQACDVENYKRPALLLEDSGWGKSNQRTITKALNKRGLKPVKEIFFDWGNLKANGAQLILADISAAQADSIFFVGNPPEGITFMRGIADRARKDRLPVISHWGITGGDFFESLGAELLTKKIDLKFIQTKFSFLNADKYPKGVAILSQAQTLFPAIKEPHDLKAATGFSHAYDLTLLLIAASKKCIFSNNIVDNRQQLHKALENIQSNIHGLLKEYKAPFRRYTNDQPDAHEALGTTDYCFGRYDKNGGITLIDSDPTN